MNGKRKKLNPFERAAFDVLKNARRPLSTNEVAYFADMSWSTAKKHLGRLYKKRNSVHTKKKGQSRLWYFK